MSMWMESTCAANGAESMKMVAVLVAIAVNEGGYRELFGAAEGVKEDKGNSVNGCVAVG